MTLLVVLLIGPTAQAEVDRSLTTSPKLEMGQLIDACNQSAQAGSDPICNVAVQIKQIGDGAIAALQAKLHLNAFETAMLTAAQAAAQGHIRLESKGYFPDSKQTLDFSRDGQVNISFEKKL